MKNKKPQKMINSGFTLSIGLAPLVIKKGNYVWNKDLNDFQNLTVLGQKPATKNDKWTIELQTEDRNIVGECDYNTAKIICLMRDMILGVEE